MREVLVRIKQIAVWGALLLGCARESSRSEEAPVHPVAATVNGRAISEAEVQLRMRERGGPANRAEALDALVLLELQAQRAEAAGAARDPDFLAQMEPVLARMRDARRMKLAKIWRLRTLAQLEPVSEADARAWLATHGDFVRAQWRLKRITTRRREEASQALLELEAGRPFDEVAAAFPGEAIELGPLGFDSIPEDWWAALAPLAPGARTPIISAGERFLILQVVERQELPLADFATLRRRIETVLQVRHFEERMRSLGEELKKGAVIEKKAVLSPPPSPEPSEG